MSSGNNKQGSKIDRYIGLKVQAARQAKTMLPEVVALKLDMDVDLYRQSEAGLRRFPAVELYELSLVFGVQLETFFPEEANLRSEAKSNNGTSPTEIERHQMMHYFEGIADADIRAELIAHVRDLSTFKD